MSMFKYFAPPEWDDDVPKNTLGENLVCLESNIVLLILSFIFSNQYFRFQTKKHKLKKGKSIKENPQEAPKDKINGNNQPTNNKNKKRKSETYELISKKKKRENVESYIKFESPKFDGSFDRNVNLNETTPGTPMSKNSWKKKQRKLNNSIESGSKSSLTNVKKFAIEPKIANNGSESSNKVLNVSSNTTDPGEVSWKTLKNRKRRAKKNKSKDADNSINQNSSPIKQNDRPKKLKKNNEDISKDVIEASSESNEISEEKNQNNKGKKSKNQLLSFMSKKSGKMNHSDRKSLLKKNKLKDVLKNTPIQLQNENGSTDINLKSENSEMLATMNSESENKKSQPPKNLRERMLERLKGISINTHLTFP